MKDILNWQSNTGNEVKNMVLLIYNNSYRGMIGSFKDVGE